MEPKIPGLFRGLSPELNGTAAHPPVEDTLSRETDDSIDAVRVTRWRVDQRFSDPFASTLVPFEVWSLANVPPTVTF